MTLKSLFVSAEFDERASTLLILATLAYDFADKPVMVGYGFHFLYSQRCEEFNV